MFLKIMTWGGERWISGPSPPPVAPAKAFSLSGYGRIFALFSRVIWVGLLTCPSARRVDSVLSGPIFSRPVNRVQSGSEPMLLKSGDLNWMRPARGLQFRLPSCWNPDRTISERPYAACAKPPFTACCHTWA